MPKAQKGNQHNKKSSRRKRQPRDTTERLINRIGKRLVRENLGNRAVRAGFISKIVGIPLKARDLPDPFYEGLKSAVVKAYTEDLRSPDPVVRGKAALRLRRLSGEGVEYPPPDLPPGVAEWRRRGRPRKDQT